MGLLLAAADIDGPLRWRWLLTDAAGGPALAAHQVDLDPASAEVARFADLYRYVRSYAAPDRVVTDGARFVAESGAWAGSEFLGPSIGSAIVAATRSGPLTVRVHVPAALDRVLLWPLELAHVNGKPLAARGDVTLVYDIATAAHADKAPAAKNEAGDALRVLAVFSQPTKTSVLALRRERYALSQLIRQIGRKNAAVQLQVVQYGVTRERLGEIAEDGDGWDILHLSGHGAGGVFTLERSDGSPDPVPTAKLIELLRPARRRVRLAVVSACESAAAATAETYRLLGLTDQAEALEAESLEAESLEAESVDGGTSTEVRDLARMLARELNCAVVGMRYPVADEFAIQFGRVLYEQLLTRGNPVDAAVARAVAVAAGPAASAARPAASLATPGIFGSAAIGLKLTVPRGRPSLDPAKQPMAYFPDEPERFVGRAEAMAQASAALACGSGKTAVLLHGMAGAGKTACALELAYRHQDAFAAAAFWQPPTGDDEWTSGLADFANRLDIQFADYGFTMAGHIGTTQHLAAFLPRLRAVLANRGLLLVLDNLETLLTPDGHWRDPRWELLVAVLVGHGGESRVILTSQIAPAGLTTSGGVPSGSPAGPVVTLPVHALSLDEAVGLARELPNLRTLLDGDPGSVRVGDAAASERADRRRVLRVLRLVQGHPKLMELANAAAVDRRRLDAQLALAEAAAGEAGDGPALEAFFRNGASSLDPTRFLGALAGWTENALGVLSPEARLMAEFVACLEEGDRLSFVIDEIWGKLWKRLSRVSDPPEPGSLLTALAAAALIQPEALVVTKMDELVSQAVNGDAGQPEAGGGSEDLPVPVGYRLHPGVAAAIMAAARPGVRDATDAELAAFWEAVSGWARTREGAEDSGLVVRAGLAAAPYLLRCGHWRTASTLLEHATMRDQSPRAAHAALPSMRRITDATGLLADVVVLAGALGRVDPDEAERLLRGAVDAAASDGDFTTASSAAGHLFNLLRSTGRLAEALEVIERKSEYTQRAGLGPWTQLADQGARLQVLCQLGEYARVLAETDALRAAMAALPASSGSGEAVNRWSVRETILDTALRSALAMGDWWRSLGLNAEITASKRRRGAGEYELAKTWSSDAIPLVRLGRPGEAARLLAKCQRVFEEHADTVSLAAVLSARADLEDELGRGPAAADLGRAALRHRYAQPDSRDIAVGHHNLANYLGRLGSDGRGQRAHRLAAVLIFGLAGVTYDLGFALRTLAAELRADGGGASLPSTVAEVVAVAELTEGVRLGALLAVLRPDPGIAEGALAEILDAAAELPPDDGREDVTRSVQAWEPLIAYTATVCQTGGEPPQELVKFLAEGAPEEGWGALAAVLRRVLAGERGESLLDGLDPISTAVARETLARIAQGR